MTVIHVEGDTIEVSADEYRVFADPGVREGFKGLVLPMKSEGVGEVEIKVEDHETDTIARDEHPYFDVPPLPEEEISVDIATRVVEVVGPAFREENKWRFAEGGATYFAEILDMDFLGRVERHDVTFGQGDALHVEMETRTSQVDTRLAYERRITKVLKHISPSEGSQVEMIDEDDDHED